MVSCTPHPQTICLLCPKHEHVHPLVQLILFLMS